MYDAKMLEQYRGKTFVIKFGGATLYSEDFDSNIEDAVLFKKRGINIVVTHGGGPQISKAMKARGKEPVFVRGLRITDKETIEIIADVYKTLNAQICSAIEDKGGKAIGFNYDNNVMFAKKKDPVLVRDEEGEYTVDLGYVGDVTAIDVETIKEKCEEGFIPVISPLCPAVGKA